MRSENQIPNIAAEEAILKMLADGEIEQLANAMRADLRDLGGWVSFLNWWLSVLERHYALSKKIHADALTLASKANSYLENLPAYENMPAETVRAEICNYLSKREDLVSMQKEWQKQAVPQGGSIANT